MRGNGGNWAEMGNFEKLPKKNLVNVEKKCVSLVGNKRKIEDTLGQIPHFSESLFFSSFSHSLATSPSRFFDEFCQPNYPTGKMEDSDERTLANFSATAVP